MNMAIEFPDVAGCDTLIQFGDLQQVSTSKPFSLVNFANNNLKCRFDKLTKNRQLDQLLFIPPAAVELVASPVADLLATPPRLAADAGIKIPKS